ncbi:MAG TPA: 4a-hydroxytetrahydrobiopterin dehydratase [Isosphaeraceae bacterium]|nr:4a-hydroxytetrahydrobiopterin dehydratase [Isosphaeraceae bacterium]
MDPLSAEQLTQKHCTPCEGGLPPLTKEHVSDLLTAVPGWKLTADGKAIRHEWRAKDFMAAIEFFNKVAAIAEEEDHHPDLHLQGYRNVAIELSTHAIDGLSGNDFILAAKIARVPIALKV